MSTECVRWEICCGLWIRVDGETVLLGWRHMRRVIAENEISEMTEAR